MSHRDILSADIFSSKNTVPNSPRSNATNLEQRGRELFGFTGQMPASAVQNYPQVRKPVWSILDFPDSLGMSGCITEQTELYTRTRKLTSSAIRRLLPCRITPRCGDLYGAFWVSLTVSACPAVSQNRRDFTPERVN